MAGDVANVVPALEPIDGFVVWTDTVDAIHGYVPREENLPR